MECDNMAEKVKNEHYVPQRYLRHFANGENFFVFDKEKTEKRPGNVGDYACERYFYDVDFDALKREKLEQDPDFEFDPEMEQVMQTIDVQHIEHWFGQNVETWLFDPINKIISTYVMANPKNIENMVAMTDDDMNHISLYLAIQMIRSKEFRENIKEMYERLPLLLMKKIAKTDEEREYINSIELEIKNKNHLKLFHAQFLMDEEMVSDIAVRLRSKIWVIGYNKTDIPFITSDNPVVKYGHSGFNGISSKGIEIAFPISPKLILILADIEEFGRLLPFHNHFVEIPSEEVHYYNSLQVIQSYRYVFSKQDEWEFVEKMLKDNPKLKDIKHKRFLML